MKIMSLRTYRILTLFGLAWAFLISFLGTYIVFKLRGWGIATLIMAIGLPILFVIIIAIAYHNGRVTWYGHPGRRIKIPFVDALESKLYDACGIESPLISKDAGEDKS